MPGFCVSERADWVRRQREAGGTDMMSTDYQFQRPMDGERRVNEIERIAVAHDDHRMRTAIFLVAANIIGVVLLISLTF